MVDKLTIVTPLEDERWMRLALAQAQLAKAQDEVPVGAVIVYQGQVIGAGFNHREHRQSVLGHAEMIAIAAANQHLHAWRLHGCTLYVTLEPCMMCTGALIQSRIDRIVYGAKDDKGGAIHSQLQLHKIPHRPHTPVILGGVLESPCQHILQDYFQTKRV